MTRPDDVEPEQLADGTAARQKEDLFRAAAASVALVVAPLLGLGPLVWLVAAVPMLALGALVPRVPGDRWWRLPVVLGLALLPAGWALGSEAPLTALTFLAAFFGGVSGSAWLLGRRA